MMTNDWNIFGSNAEIYLNYFNYVAVAEWISRVLEFVKPELGNKVPDVACGTGVLTQVAAKAVGKNGRF